MGIPTKKQFDDVSHFPEISANAFVIEAAADYRDKQKLVSLLLKAEDHFDSQIKELKKLPAVEWFYGQTVTQHALKRLRGNKNEPPNSEIAESAASSFLNAFVERDLAWHQKMYESRGRPDLLEALDQATVDSWNAPARMERRFVQRINDWLSRPRLAWSRAVLSALSDYHYTDRCRNLLHEYRNKEKDLADAEAGIEALLKLLHHSVEPLPGSGLERTLTRVKEKIEQQKRAGIATLYPVRRNDATAKERLLVTDVLNANLDHGGGKRIAIICDLMNLEGIATPLDSRTIERIAADYQGAHKEYRRKVRALSKETTGEKMRPFSAN